MMTRIIVYGLGDNFVTHYSWIKDRYEIMGLADGSPGKQGLAVHGFIVSDVAGMKKIPHDKILITPSQGRDVAQVLKKNDYEKDQFLFLTDLVSMDKSGKQMDVCFLVMGKKTEQLLAINYIYHFRNKYHSNAIVLDIACEYKASLLTKLIDKEKQRIRSFYKTDSLDDLESKYDLLIRLDFYPCVIKADKARIAKFDPNLLEYVFLCERFMAEQNRFFDTKLYMHGQSTFYEHIIGRKYIQQMDIYGYLGVSETYSFSLRHVVTSLDKYGLKSGKYITMDIDSDVSTGSWSVDRFLEAADCLRQEMVEECKVVLIGKNEIRISTKEDWFINLSGLTSFEEFVALLSHSFLHLSADGYSVHLRHALDAGKSIVLFGPTLMEFYSYSENINLRSQKCPMPCEGVDKGWDQICLRTGERPECMMSLSVQEVINAVRKLSGGRLTLLYERVVAKLTLNDIILQITLDESPAVRNKSGGSVKISWQNFCVKLTQIDFYHLVGCIYLATENYQRICINDIDVGRNRLLAEGRLGNEYFEARICCDSKIELTYGGMQIYLDVDELSAINDTFIGAVESIVAVEGFHVKNYDAIFFSTAGYRAMLTLQRVVDDTVMVDSLLSISYGEEDRLVPVSASRVARALQGDFCEVKQQIQINYCGDDNESRVSEIFRTMQVEGYCPGENGTYIVLYDDGFRIRDGCHRAACLSKLYGNIPIAIKRWYSKDNRYSDRATCQELTERNMQRNNQGRALQIANRKMYVRETLLRDLSGKRIILKGAGKHTDELLKLVGNKLDIVGIIGKTDGYKQWNYPFPFLQEDVVDESKGDVILISSFKYHDEMYSELEAYDTGLPIYDIYRQGVLKCEFFT